MSNSPYCLILNSFDLNSENLVLDQLIFPLLFFLYSHYLSAQYCFNNVGTNSVLVAHGSCRVDLLFQGDIHISSSFCVIKTAFPG